MIEGKQVITGGKTITSQKSADEIASNLIDIRNLSLWPDVCGSVAGIPLSYYLPPTWHSIF